MNLFDESMPSIQPHESTQLGLFPQTAMPPPGPARSRSGIAPSMPEVVEALRRVEALTTQFQALSALLDAPARGDADGTMHRKERV